MPTLQQALLAATFKPSRSKSPAPALKPAIQRQQRPKALRTVQYSRRVPYGTFDVPLRPLVEEHEESRNDSRPPPEHEPNFPERYFA